MNCPKCNTALNPGAAFCAVCGLNLTAPAGHQAPPPMQYGAPGHGPPGPPGYPPPGYPPPGYGPPGGYGYPPPPMAPKTSGMAIAGFVLSFFCSLLGLIFSIIGYNEVKKSNGMVTGGGLAVAGIIISIIGMIIGIGIAASGNKAF